MSKTIHQAFIETYDAITIEVPYQDSFKESAGYFGPMVRLDINRPIGVRFKCQASAPDCRRIVGIVTPVGNLIFFERYTDGEQGVVVKSAPSSLVSLYSSGAAQFDEFMLAVGWPTGHCPNIGQTLAKIIHSFIKTVGAEQALELTDGKASLRSDPKDDFLGDKLLPYHSPQHLKDCFDRQVEVSNGLTASDLAAMIASGEAVAEGNLVTIGGRQYYIDESLPLGGDLQRHNRPSFANAGRVDAEPSDSLKRATDPQGDEFYKPHNATETHSCEIPRKSADHIALEEWAYGKETNVVVDTVGEPLVVSDNVTAEQRKKQFLVFGTLDEALRQAGEMLPFDESEKKDGDES